MLHQGQLGGGSRSDLALSAFWCSTAMYHLGQLGGVHLILGYLHSCVVGLCNTRVD